MLWVFDQDAIDWAELSELYRIAPLADKKPDDLRRAFSNSMYKCFVFDDGDCWSARARAVADGVDCSYLCDVAVHPEVQGRGLGGAIVDKLVELSCRPRQDHPVCQSGHGSLLQQKRGFLPMKTAMAIFKDPDRAINRASRRRRVSV